MADSTSRAAASMSRFRLNCNVMLVDPRLLEEVISLTDAICPNCLSRGVATEDAIVSGLAPGSDAETEMVGKSTCGSGDTGSIRNATAPESAIATVSSVVAVGLRMNISDMFMPQARARGLSPPSVFSRELPDACARSGPRAGQRKDK